MNKCQIGLHCQFLSENVFVLQGNNLDSFYYNSQEVSVQLVTCFHCSSSKRFGWWVQGFFYFFLLLPIQMKNTTTTKTLSVRFETHSLFEPRSGSHIYRSADDWQHDKPMADESDGWFCCLGCFVLLTVGAPHEMEEKQR